MQGRYAPHILDKQMVFLRCLATLVPGAVAVSIAILLASSAQAHEVLLRAFEGTVTREIAGLGVFTLLCMLLGTWDYHLSTSIKDTEYSLHANPYLDRLLGRLIAVKALVITALPFIGLMLGLYWAWKLQTPQNLQALQGAELKAFADATLRTATFARFGQVMGMAVALLAITLLVIFIVHRSRVQLLNWLLVATLTLGSLTIVLGWLLPAQLTSLAILAGSFSILSLVTMGLVTLFFVITFLVQRRVSIITLVISAVMVIATFSFTRGEPVSAAGEGVQADAPEVGPPAGKAFNAQAADLEQAFMAWAAARKLGGNGTRSDPVFIVALPGGGIYAASAGAGMLAALQDRCPAFARHVFAVSAVSGGAVGATIFNTLLSSLPEPTTTRCERLEPRDKRLHERHVRRVIVQDHLAPVGAFLLPDLLRKLPGLIGVSGIAARFDRAQALEISVSKALAGLTDDGKRQVVADNVVEESYWKHWRVDGRVPALVLNTTWVETGSRVAFAPFKLKKAGGGDLLSFADDWFQHSDVVANAKVLQAGVVSARFPGTSPAWQLADIKVPVTVEGKPDQQRLEAQTWNFVDGGYADNSGMLTAYDMYKVLSALIKTSGLSIDLRIVALGDDRLEELPKGGTSYTDTIAPLSALLNLRRRGLVEVAREMTGIDPQDPRNADRLDRLLSARSGASPKLLVFRLNRDEFPLTLGWTISSYRNSTIRLQLGEPELCVTENVQKNRAADVILANSCVQREILGLLGARWPQPADPRVPGGG